MYSSQLFEHFRNSINRYLTRFTALSATNTEQHDLLSGTEILDLYHRIQLRKNSAPAQPDIAYRQMGDNRSVYRGYGMDYEESRPYHPGDDPRYMNWKLTARTGQHFMKVFREERQSGTFIMMDRRHSMRFATRTRLKVTQAARIAALAAFNAQQNNASIGGVILNQDIKWSKESHNKQAAFDFIRQATTPCPAIYTNENEPRLNSIFSLMNEILKPGTTIFLISDFHDLDPKEYRDLLRLSFTHQIHAYHIYDDAEQNLPVAGPVNLKSSLQDSDHKVDTNNENTQQYYAEEAETYFNDIQQLFSRCAITYHAISTQLENIEELIPLT